MPTLSEVYRSSLDEVVSGEVVIDQKGRFYANAPRLSLIISGFQIEECGITCTFIHLLKKRNGHYYVFKPSDTSLEPCEMPEWEVESDKGTIGFIEKPNEHLLAYSHSLFVPVLYRDTGGITFLFDLLRNELHEHLAIVAENQLYTQEWYRYVRSKGKR